MAIKKKIDHIKSDYDLVELLRGSFRSFTAKILGMSFGFIMVIFISNFYGAEELGLFSLSLTILNITVLIPKFGFEQSLVKILGEVNVNGNKNDFLKVLIKSTSLSFILSVIFAIILFFFCDFLALKVFKNDSLLPYIKCITFAIPASTLLVIISGAFQALKKTFNHTLYKTAFVNIAFTTFLLLNNYVLEHFENIFLLYTCATYLVFFIGLFSLRKHIDKQVFKERESLDIKTSRIISTSLPMLYSNSLALMIAWINVILLGYFMNEFDVGIYDSAERLATLSTVVLIAVNSIVATKFSESYAKNDLEELKKVTKQSTKMIFFFTTPILLVLIIFGKQILNLFGSEFVVGYWALVFLCVSKFVGAAVGSVGYLLQMTGRQKTYTNIIAISFLINLVLGLILIPKYGYLGAAIAGSVAVMQSNITSMFIIRKRLGFWTLYIPLVSKLN